MKKKLLKQIVLSSYKNGELHDKTITQIADILDRKDLKQYITALKQSEKLRTVFIDMALAEVGVTKEFQKFFGEKKVVIRTDPSLLAGMRVTDNDDIFQMNLKHNLDAIIEHVESN